MPEPVAVPGRGPVRLIAAPVTALAPLRPGASGVDHPRVAQPGPVGAPTGRSGESTLARNDPAATNSTSERGLVQQSKADVSGYQNKQGGPPESRALMSTPLLPSEITSMDQLAAEPPAPAPAPSEEGPGAGPVPAPTSTRVEDRAGSPPPPPEPPTEEPSPAEAQTVDGKDVVLARVKDYQRIRQQERGFWGKMGHALADDLLAKVGEARLNRFIADYRAENGSDPILTTALVKHVLDNKGNYDKAIAAAESAQLTGKAHVRMLKIAKLGEGENIHELAEDDPRLIQAKKVVKDILKVNIKGKLTDDQVEELANQNSLDVEDVKELVKGIASVSDLGEKAHIEFHSPEAFMNGVSDELLYAGLSPSQYEQAKRVARRANVAAVASVVRVAAIVAVPHFALTWQASAIASGLISGGARIPKLFTQEAVYSMNRDRVANSAQAKGPSTAEKWLSNRWLIRQMAVDWSQDRKTYPWQIFRAVAFGGALGAISHGAQHIGEVQHGVGDVLNNLHHVDTSQVAHAATPDVPLPSAGPLHAVTVEGHQFMVGSNVNYDPSTHSLYILDHGQHVDVGHVQNGQIEGANGYNISEVQGPQTSVNTADYMHDHGAQTISPEHHTIEADQRQFEAYVKANSDGSADLTLPPGDNAIMLPNGEMFHFNPQDLHVDSNVTTIHVAPDDPMYHVLIDPKAMHQLYVDEPNGGTMLDGVHNGATTTYMTGHWDGNVFEQHSTVNGSYPLPQHITSQSTELQITHPAAASTDVDTDQDAFQTAQGAWVHNVGEQGADLAGHATDYVMTHFPQVAGTAAFVAYGYLLSRHQRLNPGSRAHILAMGSEGVLGAGWAAGLGMVVPGYPIGLAAGYLAGSIGKRKGQGKESSGGDKASKTKDPYIFADYPTVGRYDARPTNGRSPSPADTNSDRGRENLEAAARTNLPPAGSPPPPPAPTSLPATQPSVPALIPPPAPADEVPAEAAGANAPTAPGAPSGALPTAEVPAQQAIGAPGAGNGADDSGPTPERLGAPAAGETGEQPGASTALEQRAAIGEDDKARAQYVLLGDLAYRQNMNTLMSQPLESFRGLSGEQLNQVFAHVGALTTRYPDLSGSQEVQTALQRLIELTEKKDASNEERLAAFEELRQTMARVRPPKTEIVLVKEAEETLPQGELISPSMAQLLDTFPAGIALRMKKEISVGNPDLQPERLLSIIYHKMPDTLTDDDFAAIAQVVYGDAERGQDVEAAFEKMNDAVQNFVPPVFRNTPADDAPGEERPAA